jgi:hypothetical protein
MELNSNRICELNANLFQGLNNLKELNLLKNNLQIDNILNFNAFNEIIQV